MPESKTKAAFIKPMLLLQTERLPEGSKWAYELKLDGYRALAIKTGGKVREYRDHRLEWMIKSGGIEVVFAGLRDGNIRFPWPNSG